MPSYILFAPMVDSYMPSFAVKDGKGECKIYFEPSKVGIVDPSKTVKGIHLTICKQDTDVSVVNNGVNNNNRYRKNDMIIINQGLEKDETGKYYVTITEEDIKGGWSIGQFYKCHIRFSTIPYNAEQYDNFQNWLVMKSKEFSEWSTSVIVKATAEPVIRIPMLGDYDSSDEEENDLNAAAMRTIYATTLDVQGSFECADKKEKLYCYKFELYEKSDVDYIKIEESDIIYVDTQENDKNSFKYVFETECEDKQFYKIVLTYQTNNKFEQEISIPFVSIQASIDNKIYNLYNLENIDLLRVGQEIINEKGEVEVFSNSELADAFEELTSIGSENDNARIGLLIVDRGKEPFFGTICIRRADSKSNFKKWYDIKTIPVNGEDAYETFPRVFFDYVIESGVYYQYKIQIIDTKGRRSKTEGIHYLEKASRRDFEYSYLIDDRGRQLKLNLNNDLSSYMYTVSETKVDTISGKYPYVNRNGNMRYRTFPLNAMISFNMDIERSLITHRDCSGEGKAPKRISPNNIYGEFYYDGNDFKTFFFTEEELYENSTNLPSYEDVYKSEGFYDYKREQLFREKVIAFLQDGKAKLFKSATEGNIIIDVMGVNLSPLQQLSRLVASMTSTANEIAEYNYKNCVKYNFFDANNISYAPFEEEEWIGQIVVNNIDPWNPSGYGAGKKDYYGTNIIDKIIEKYSFEEDKIGYAIELKELSGLSVQLNNYNEKSGNSPFEPYSTDRGVALIVQQGDSAPMEIRLNDQDYFNFGDSIVFSPSDKIYVSQNVEILIDFKTTVKKMSYEDGGRQPVKEVYLNGAGQFKENIEINNQGFFDVIKELEKRYSYSLTKPETTSTLNQITAVTIEAANGVKFKVTYMTEGGGRTETITMNETEFLNLVPAGDISELKVLGTEGQNISVLIDYEYQTITKIYDN